MKIEEMLDNTGDSYLTIKLISKYPGKHRNKMLRILFLIMLIIFAISFCGSEQDKVERTIENGVEVILNYLEPYKIKGEPSSLDFEEDLIIDLERPDLAVLGIADITGFDVDSEGNIYLGSAESTENFIFKFEKNGKYVSSFCHFGQGPGEIQRLGYWRINERDEVLITNTASDQLIVFSSTGDLIKQVPIASNHIITTLVESGMILAMKFVRKPGEGLFYPIVICDDDLTEIKILRQGQRLQNYIAAKELNGLNLSFDYAKWGVSKGHIYIGNKFNGYEFLIYDSKGLLVKKIRKKYNPVKVPQQVKDKVIERFDTPSYNQNNIKGKIFFPANMPPFQYFFIDDIGRLYVMTYEKGEGEKDFIYDIFNPEGFFISRTVLDNSGNILGAPPFQGLSTPWGGPYEVRVKKNLLYYLRSKESGYQELVVCKMKWEGT